MKGNSKRGLPIAVIVFLQLIAVYILALSLQRELTEQFSSNAQVTLDSMTESVIDRTIRFLKPVHDAVSVGVDMMNHGILDGDDDRALEAYFKAQLDATPWLSGLFLGRDDGSFVYLARNEFGYRVKRISIDNGARVVELVQRSQGGEVAERWNDVSDEYDPRSRAWYIESSGSKFVNWTDPYLFFSSGLPGISASARTRSGMTLGADVELQELSDFIDAIPHAKDGVAVIIDDELRVVVRSGSATSQPKSATIGIPALSDVAEPSLLALHDANAANPSNKDLVQLSIDSRNYLGMARTFPISEGVDNWTLLVQMVADDYAGGALNFFNRRLVMLGMITIGLGMLAIGGLFWLYRSDKKRDLDETLDPSTGALYQHVFDNELNGKFMLWQQQGSCVGVMIVEALGVRRLADRHGDSCRNEVLSQISHRVKLELNAEEFLGISRNGRFLIAVHAQNLTMLLQRFDHLHECLANNTHFTTPTGIQRASVATGAAILEENDTVDNLIPRAREALTIGIDNGSSGCQLAVGINAHDLSGSGKAA